MNSFGNIFRVSVFGESHGESVGVVIDGCPAGLSLAEEDLLPDLERRKGGKQKGTTPRQEADYPIFKSGLFNGKTTGFPITILFENNNTRSEDYQKQRSIPRPGHADWVAHQKFGGYEDYRGGGHFSARLTTGLVAAGAIAKKLIIEIDGEYHDTEDQIKYDAARSEWLNEHNYYLLRFTNKEVLNNISEVVTKVSNILEQQSTVQITESSSTSPLERGLGGEVTVHAAVTEIGGEKDLEKGLQRAIDAKDSVGGLVECRVNGLPVGLGEPYFDSLESSLAHIVFAIPAVRGIEFGTGFAAAKMFGSEHNDAIENMEGKTRTNHAGGIVGGISNGNELVFRIAIKPTSSTPKQQNSLNWDTQKMEDFSIKGRHDLCVALRAPVILEAATAVTLVDFLLREQHIKRVLS